MEKPATAESGFIFSIKEREDPLTSDTFYLRLLSWHLPSDIFTSIQPELRTIVNEASSDQVKGWLCNAEAQQPYVKTHNVWGARHDVDLLVTSEGWKQLRSWGAKRGVVAIGYEDNYGEYKRVVQHAKNYFFSPSSALTGCPLSMTDGAAKLLTKILPNVSADHPFHEVYNRLIDRDQYWTSGQWMTERPGGSDVQKSETWATYSPLANKSGQRLDQGDYLISGFKFFSSATDADVTVMLAKTSSGKLSAFLAPLTKVDDDGKVVSNGIRIHRLKQKLGTKQLPTAELELKDVRAHLVGPVDRGVKTIADILNITRAHAFMGSCSGWRRCISMAKAFAKSRETFGMPLWLLPLHLRTLAEMELKLRSCLHMSFFTVSLLSFSENGLPQSTSASLPLPTSDQLTVVLRTLTATTKAVSSKTATAGIQECMEAMGGVGYIDDPDEPENVARALRDINVNAIWEGTTNLLSNEVIGNLLRGNHLELFSEWLDKAIAGVTPEFKEPLRKAWQVVRDAIAQGLGALNNGRRIMFSLAWVVSGLLFAADAQRDGDQVSVELARRWFSEGGDWLLPGVEAARVARVETDRVNWDCRIVWGVELPGSKSKSKI